MTPTSSLVATPWLRHGAVGGAALGALLLLAVFYAVVSGAVEHAASRRAEAGSDRASAVVTLSAPAGRTIRLARLGS